MPIEPPHHTLLQNNYNKTHVVQYLCSPHFPWWYYPSHRSKQCPPLSDAERTPKHISLSTTSSLLCIHPTPANEYYYYPCHPQQHPFSAPPYCLPFWYPPPHSGTGHYLPTPVTSTYPSIYTEHNKNNKI